MLPEYYQQSVNGLLPPSLLQNPLSTEARPLFQIVPMNLSAEEIRAMVRDILG